MTQSGDMASFLTIPELMTTVFEYSRSQKDLLNFALVCTQWTDWALDIRWRNCDVPLSAVLRPLLSLANSIEANTNGTQYQDFTDEQWAAFMAKSTKVTSVVCEFTLPDDLYQPLRTRIDHSSENPFRRVQKLTIVPCETDSWTAHFVCESPALSSCRLCDHDGKDSKDPDLSLTFYEVVQGMPTITDMEFDLPGYTYVPHLNGMHDLQRLSCHGHKINYTWWRILSSCKELKELRLEETSQIGSWEVGVDVEFPVLRSLLLDVEEVMATTIIYNSRFPALDNLSFGSRSLSADEMDRARVHLNKWSPRLRF